MDSDRIKNVLDFLLVYASDITFNRVPDGTAELVSDTTYRWR